MLLLTKTTLVEFFCGNILKHFAQFLSFEICDCNLKIQIIITFIWCWGIDFISVNGFNDNKTGIITIVIDFYIRGELGDVDPAFTAIAIGIDCTINAICVGLLFGFSKA